MSRFFVRFATVAVASSLTLSGCFLKDLINDAIEGFEEIARDIEALQTETPQDLASAAMAFKGAAGAVNGTVAALEAGAPGTSEGAKRLMAAAKDKLRVAHAKLAPVQSDGDSGWSAEEFCTGEAFTEPRDCPGGGSSSVSLTCTPNGAGATLEVEIVATACVDYLAYEPVTDVDDGGTLPLITSVAPNPVTPGGTLTVTGVRLGAGGDNGHVLRLQQIADCAEFPNCSSSTVLTIFATQSEMVALWSDNQVEVTLPTSLDSGGVFVEIETPAGKNLFLTELIIEAAAEVATAPTIAQAAGQAQRFTDGRLRFVMVFPSLGSEEFDSLELEADFEEEVSVDGMVQTSMILEGYRMRLQNGGITINGRAANYDVQGGARVDLTYTDFILGAQDLTLDVFAGNAAITIDGQLAISVAAPDENVCIQTELMFETLAPIVGLAAGSCPTGGEVKIIRRDDSYAQYRFNADGSVTVKSGDWKLTLACGDIDFDGALACR